MGDGWAGEGIGLLAWGWAELAWLRMAPWRGDSELGSANGTAGPVGVAGLTEWDVATGKSWLAGSCANWGLCRVWAWSVHLARSQLKW